MRCEDSFVSKAFDDGSQLYVVFDGTDDGLMPGAAYDCAQEVAARLPLLVGEEMARMAMGAVGGGGSRSSSQTSQEKRPRAALSGEEDRRRMAALRMAVERMDDLLYEMPQGHHGGGSLVMLYVWGESVFSLVLGDCEGAAFKIADGLERKFARWPHNCNFSQEQVALKKAWGLDSLDFFDWAEERQLFFLRDLQTTRFLGCWINKLKCRHQLESRHLCNAPSAKGAFYCSEHIVAHAIIPNKTPRSYWTPEVNKYALSDFDFFLFATDGMWDQFTTGRACEIVAHLPLLERPKAPKVLIDTALKQAVFSDDLAHPRRRLVQPGDPVYRLATLDAVKRRQVHDDITCTVVFPRNDIDRNLLLTPVIEIEEAQQEDEEPGILTDVSERVPLSPDVN